MGSVRFVDEVQGCSKRGMVPNESPKVIIPIQMLMSPGDLQRPNPSISTINSEIDMESESSYNTVTLPKSTVRIPAFGICFPDIIDTTVLSERSNGDISRYVEPEFTNNLSVESGVSDYGTDNLPDSRESLDHSDPFSVEPSSRPLLSFSYDTITKLSTVSLSNTPIISGNVSDVLSDLGLTEPSFGHPIEDYMMIEPLLADFPSVDHNFTSKIKLISSMFKDPKEHGFYQFCHKCDIGDILTVSDTLNYFRPRSSNRHTTKNGTGSVAMKCVVSRTVDVTVLPQEISSYSHFLRFISARNARLASLRNKVLISFSCAIEYPPPPPRVWYDYLYDLSKWKKFTEGRPETHIFFRGRTYTYDQLPSFPVSKQKSSIPKPNRKKKKAVTSSVCKGNASFSTSVASVSSASVLSNTVLNPLAPAFNVHFTNAKDCGATLNEIRVQNVKNIVIAHLNINSLRTI